MLVMHCGGCSSWFEGSRSCEHGRSAHLAGKQQSDIQVTRMNGFTKNAKFVVGFRSFLPRALGSGMNITSFGMNAHWGNIGGQCCQRAFAWFNPAEYNMDHNTHTNGAAPMTASASGDG